MTFFISSNLSHAYIYGNYWKYPTVFGKFLKCLKMVSYAFLDFLKFSKNHWKSWEIFWKVWNFLKFFKTDFTSFENLVKINIRETSPNTHIYSPCQQMHVNKSECRKLQDYIICIHYNQMWWLKAATLFLNNRCRKNLKLYTTEK